MPVQKTQRGLKGGSLASDALCHSVDPAAYDLMNNQATDIPLTVFVHKGGALQNIVDRKLVLSSMPYHLRNQNAGAATDPVPLVLPGDSGASQYNYSLLPNGVMSSMTQPTSLLQPANMSVVYPSYYANYSPGMTGGKRSKR